MKFLTRELKICEGCGGLFVRETGAGKYCRYCSPRLEAKPMSGILVAVMAAAVKAPSAAAIDELARRYAAVRAAEDEAKAIAKVHGEAADRLKAELLHLVDEFGLQSSAASRRLKGVHATLTATRGTITSVVPAAVDRLRSELESVALPEVADQLFTRQVTYQLVQTPGEVLQRVDLPTRLRTKLQKMVALCFEQKTKAPSLKVELVEASAA